MRSHMFCAKNIYRTFKAALPLSGIVLTKLDGDSRGGAALPVRQITGTGVLVQEVNRLLKKFEQMQCMMKQMPCRRS